MNQRRDTMLVDDPDDDWQPARGGSGSAPSRPVNPITIALIVAGVLAIIGISLAVLAPLVSGTPTADTMPAGVGATGSLLPTGAAAPTTSAGPATLPSVKPTTKAPTLTPTAKIRQDDLENQVIQLTNNARKQAGCKDVKNNSRLHSVARAHSTDMAKNNSLSSTGSDGSSYKDRATRAGYKDPLGENISHGQNTAAAVVQAWLGNGTTKGRMLDCSATSIGMGVAQAADGSLYWTQDFGK